MENYAKEVVMSIVECFKDDRYLVRDVLYFLNDTTLDTQLKHEIQAWFNAEHICLGCRSEMIKTDGVYICPQWHL